MIIGPVMLVIGLALSAFFSGSETGFYRVTRLRLVTSARAGDWFSGRLLWLTNNPALFVATTLVGNNVANYLTSLAVVLITKELFPSESTAVELMATILFSPLVFIYGESLPKTLYYNAPNLLLRRGAPLFLLFTLIFAPVSAVLWVMGRALQALIGETPLRVQLALARKELQDVLLEGQDIGLLKPEQRLMAQNLFLVAAKPISIYCRAILPATTVTLGESCESALQKSRRHRLSSLPVLHPEGRELAGYVRAVELRLSDSKTVEKVRSLQTFKKDQSHIEVLTRLQSSDEDMAAVVDENDNPIGVIYSRQLAGLLFRES